MYAYGLMVRKIVKRLPKAKIFLCTPQDVYKRQSYNRLSAQYALNKIRLNQMSAAEREAADSGKKLEADVYKRQPRFH